MEMMRPLDIGVADSGVGSEHVEALNSLRGRYRVLALCGIDESKDQAEDILMLCLLHRYDGRSS